MKTVKTYKEKWITTLSEIIHHLNDEYYILISTTWDIQVLSSVTNQMQYLRERTELIKKLRTKAYKIDTKEFIPRRFPTAFQLSLKLTLPIIYNKIYEKRKKEERIEKKNCCYIKRK